MKAPPAALLLGVLTYTCVQAFPPAPYYTLFGLVRDQVGQVVPGGSAEIILLKGGSEVGRAPVTSDGLDENYNLNIRIDQNRSGTSLYDEGAVAANGLFSLAVEMEGAVFYPIEVSGDLTAGKGGERVRLDLNLGADTDGDGLPDVWEEWQLFQAGYFPDEDGTWDLSLISKDGDLDGDGQTDGQEYITGTFAGDATETFGLDIKEKTPEFVRLEFYQITGKTYTIERSNDLQTWERVPFSVGSPGSGSPAYQADNVGITSAFCAPSQGASALYRLTVR